MKAADPTIKVGVVAAPGEDSYANGYTAHPALNPRTGTSHNGWTAVMLSTLRSLAVTPDFIVHHRYPEFTSNPAPLNCTESDPLLLQTTSWANDVADLRQQISDYFGPTGRTLRLYARKITVTRELRDASPRVS